MYRTESKAEVRMLAVLASSKPRLNGIVFSIFSAFGIRTEEMDLGEKLV